MKATFLGFTVPDELITEINRNDSHMATQTHRFAWGVVTGLRVAGVDIELVSAAPVSDYPRNPHKFLRGGTFDERGVHGVLLPFVNILGLKHITRWLAARMIGGSILRQSRPDWLLVHGVHSPFLWFAATVPRRLEVKVAVFLTDPPGVVLDSDSALRRLLKRVDIGLTKRALARVDGVIVLAEPLAVDFAPGVPSLTMEGLFDAGTWINSTTQPVERTTTQVITYAGGLSEEYGVRILVHAVRRSSNPNIRLQLLGRGPLEHWIKKQSLEDSRVLPPRLVDPKELGTIYTESAVLVQPRPVDQVFVRYSFPSKMLEYMASGVPVISTRLPSIPADYDGLVEWAVDTASGLQEAIERVLARPAERRSQMGANAARFVMQTRSTTAQGLRMRQFLSELSGDSTHGEPH